VSANRQFLLMGAGEFEPWSEGVERVALQGRPQMVTVCPTASAPEGDAVFDRWAGMALEHYASMDMEARVAPLKRREDADRPEAMASLEGAGMVFFSGGNPRFLADTLDGTAFWSAILAAIDRGLVFAGCSAGAMVAGRRTRERPRMGSMWAAGLGLVDDGAFGAHWDRMRFIPGMLPFVRSRAGDGWFAGIDERTAILGDGRSWRVYGLGTVVLRLEGRSRTLRSGETFSTS
jgi:cyanophycinase